MLVQMQKPFFYKWDGKQFIFSSTLEALLVTCQKTPSWDKKYFLNYILNEGVANDMETPYKGLSRLPAGTVLVFDNGQLETRKYWSISEIKNIRLSNRCS